MNPTSSHDIQWEGKFLKVIKAGHWEYADRLSATGAVAIVAVTQDNKLLLTEQFRIPMRCRVIEPPAGLVGDQPSSADELMIEAARRELQEETGYSAANWEKLASGPPSAGLATEIVTFFLATDLRRVGSGGGVGHEDIVVHEVPLDSIQDWLQSKEQSGLLIDPKIYAGLYFLLRKQQVSGTKTAGQ